MKTIEGMPLRRPNRRYIDELNYYDLRMLRVDNPEQAVNNREVWRKLGGAVIGLNVSSKIVQEKFEKPRFKFGYGKYNIILRVTL